MEQLELRFEDIDITGIVTKFWEDFALWRFDLSCHVDIYPYKHFIFNDLVYQCSHIYKWELGDQLSRVTHVTAYHSLGEAP